MVLRQRIAQKSPPALRKAVRVCEHYIRRYGEWASLMRDCSGISANDKIVLGTSFLASPFTSLRRLDGFEPPLLLRDIELAVRGVGRFRIRAGTDDIIHVQASREPHVVRQLKDFLKPGGVFVDAGANIGFYSIMASKLVGRTGTVIAIEMLPDTATQLRLHVADNDGFGVNVVEMALSDRTGQTIDVVYDLRKLGQATIMQESGSGNSTTASVKTATLDEILQHIEHVDLIKMDLEGAEYSALVGCRQSLSKINRIIFESNSADKRAVSILEGAGFTVELLAGNDYLALRKKLPGKDNDH